MATSQTIRKQRFTPKNEKQRIARVVEELGVLNDRRMQALACDDLAELESVAQAYESRRMTDTASQIRFAISLRKGKRSDEKEKRMPELRSGDQARAVPVSAAG